LGYRKGNRPVLYNYHTIVSSLEDQTRTENSEKVSRFKTEFDRASVRQS